MKSADFNRTEGKLRVLQEVRPGKKKVNWDRLIYFSLILLIILTSLYYVARNNLYTRADGQVLFRKLDIQFTQDVQIIDVVKIPGSQVKVAIHCFCTMMKRAINQPPPPPKSIVNASSDNLDWIVRERLTYSKKN